MKIADIQKKLDLKFVQDYERKLHIPKWYRGVSQVQMGAEGHWINSLRDDIGQGTTYRTKRCLKKLGVHPLPPNKLLSMIIKVSRGSDLAFFFFLLEAFYKTADEEDNNGERSYDPNEQLLMTAIYHLDLITTIRELNQILPPGHPSKEDLELQQKRSNKKARESEKKRNVENKVHIKEICDSPYFQKQPVPKYYGKSLQCKRPPFRHSFPFQEFVDNPLYVVPNSQHNWFKDIQLEPDKMVAKSIVNECFKKILSKRHTHELDCVTNLKCEEFKVVSELQNIVQCRFKLIVDDVCLRTFKRDSKQWQERFDSITWRLLNEIKKFLKFYNIYRLERKNAFIQVINPNGTKLYFETQDEVKMYLNMFRSLYLNRKRETCPGSNEEEFSDIDFKIIPTIITLSRGDNWNIIVDGPKIKRKCCLKNISIDGTDNIMKRKQKCIYIEGRVPCLKDAPIREDEVHSNDSEIPLKPEDIFFRTPTPTSPYMFDTRKIFKYSTTENDDFKKIKDIFLTALNEGLNKPYECLSNYPDISKATEHCIMNVFVDKIKKLNTEKPKAVHRISPLFVGQFFDCDDHELMVGMLKAAFDYMKKDPKFVLVTLPDAHRLPTFIEYIKKRYGKSYSRKEIAYSKHEANGIFERMIRLFSNSSNIPNIANFLTNRFIGIKYRNCLIDSFKPVFDDIKYRTVNRFLENSRLFIAATKPYLPSFENTPDTHFPYIPARHDDVQLINIWQSNQYRDMAPFSRHRQIQLSKTLANSIF